LITLHAPLQGMLPFINIFTLILDAGANLNFKFPFRLPVTQADMIEARLSRDSGKANKEPENKYLTTVLINNCRFVAQRSVGLGTEDFA